jgi:hypothetical protein
MGGRERGEVNRTSPSILEIDDDSGIDQVSSDAHEESPRGTLKFKDDKKTRCIVMGVVSRGR